MIIDLCDFLKDRNSISVSDTHINYKNSLRFVDDHLNGYLFSIDINDYFIIEIYKSTNKYLLIVWNMNEESSFFEKNNISPLDLKEEIIKNIIFCEKYFSLKTFI